MKQKVKSRKKIPKSRETVQSLPEQQKKSSLISYLPYIALFLLWVLFFNKILSGTAHLWEDILYQEFPHRIYAAKMLQMFRFPHWNPYTFGGMPFFSAIHTGVLYPGNLILSFLPLSTGQLWYALQLMIVFHFLIAGICMFMMCRYFNISRLSSLFAGVSFAFCGFFVVHIIHSLMLYILAWLPLIVLLFHKGIREDKFRYIALGGTVLGVTILAGHPQITFYEFLFLGAFSLYLFLKVSEKKKKHIVFLGAGFIIAVGLGMVQLLPAFELSGQSARVDWTFQMASEGSMSFRQLLTFVIPKLFGATNSNNPWRSELVFWLKDSYHSGYWTFWETTFYTGVVTLLLALFQFRKIRKDRFVTFSFIWCILSLAIALGSHFPLFRFFYEFVPGFGRFRIPSRILFTLNFLFPFLAARTLDEIKSADVAKPYFRYSMISSAICLLLGITVISGLIKMTVPELSHPKLMQYAIGQANIMIWMVVLFASSMVLFRKKVIGYVFLKSILLLVIVLDLFIFGYNFHIVPQSGVHYFSRGKQLVSSIKKVPSSEPFRVNTRGTSVMLLDRNQGMIDSVHMMEGYNPLNLFRKEIPIDKDKFFDLFNVKFKIAEGDKRQNARLMHNPSYLPRAKLFYRYKYSKTDSSALAFMNSDSYDHHSVVVLHEKPTLKINDSGSGEVEIVSYSENRIELHVNSKDNGILWLSEVWYPAWKAKLNGRQVPIIRSNYSFRAIEIPEGKHTVVFYYASDYFQIGFVVSLIAVLFLVSYAIMLKKEVWHLGKSKT
ncbi:MAG: YfhO family protein [Bacteroidota bacterium]